MEDRKRLFINVLRGVAVFLMLWGHTIQYCSAGTFDFFENKAFQTIYSFHMPLFMLISGYLFYFSFKKRNLGGVIQSRIQSLLHPIFAGTILYYILTTVLFSVLQGHPSAFLGIGSSINNLSGIWFLWSVLACSITVGIVCKVTDNHLFQVFLLILGIPFVAFFPNWSMNLYMYPYFVIGFIFAYLPDNRVKNIIIKCRYIALVLFPALMLFYTKDHFIYTSGLHITQYNNLDMLSIDMFRWLIGLIGSVFAITVIDLIFNLIYNLNSESRVLNFVGNLGIKSLQIYVLQRIFLESWLKVLYSKLVEILGYNFLASNIQLYNLVFTPLIAFIFSVALLLLIQMLDKLKVSSLVFGR